MKMKIRTLLAAVLGITALALLFLAIWFPENYAWLQFGLSAVVVGIAAICVAASADSDKRP